jgi:LysR family transcriptional regulator, transcriptional activator of the cysJI operon
MHLNFRKAAERLFLTQPAVTLQIQALENDLGTRLFDRTGGKITLTPQGSLLLDYAKKLATMAIEAERDLGCSEGSVSGELVLGASTTISQYVLPRLLGAFQNEYPKIHFSLRSGNTSDVVRDLTNRRVTLGLIEGSARERSVRTEPFMEDELVLITPPRSNRDRLAPRQFLAASLLMREQGSGSRHVVELALEKAGFKLKAFKKVMELDSTEAIKSAVN